MSWTLRPGILTVLLTSFLYPISARSEGAQGRPNILLAIADDWSHDHAGAYGSDWVKTPTFDRIAREGVLFHNAFTSNPKCSPSRASMLTGRNTWQLEEAANHFGVFSAKYRVYPDLLEEAGYFVGYTGKGWGPGDHKAGGFKRNPAGPAFQEHRLDRPLFGTSGLDYAANFEAFLEARNPDQPFCFWYGAHEPHRPFAEGAGTRSGRRLEEVELPSYYPDSYFIRSDLLDYSLEVEWFDGHLGKMIEVLEERGELENTFVLVTSDHGMPFPRAKGQVYDDGFHLPLAVRWGKGIKGGREIDDFVNARDFAPTFLELAGLEPHPQMTGRSFLDLLESGKSGTIDATRNRMLAGKERHDVGRPHDRGYPIRALRTPDYLYIRNYEPDRWPAGNPETGYPNSDVGPTRSLLLRKFDAFYKLSFGKRPAEELYRISDDPDCVTNLAGRPEFDQTREELRREMEQRLREEQDPRMLGNAAVFDTYEYTGPRWNAYDTWLRNQ